MRKLVLAIPNLGLLLLAFTAGAAAFTNHFDSGLDLVAHGIIGNTNWDGVYLGYGDILNGDPGGDGAGRTLQANETVTPGQLTVQTIGSTWAGTGDDGFYAYKVVRGDFDVSVKTAPPWTPLPYTCGGLLVRAWNTNNSGAPASFTDSPSENWLALWRLQEFGLDEIRVITNGFNFQATFPESDADTNASRYFRITRTGDVFAFYWKTNLPQAWTLITNATQFPWLTNGTIERPDWRDQPVQIGIAEATFSGNSPTQYFADFQLSGPNVTFPPMPPGPSDFVMLSTNPAGVTFSWTPGNPGDGSLVVMRQAGSIQHNPVNGHTYKANPAFGDTNTCLGGGNEFVVYDGNGNSVTVSNVSGGYRWYIVALYEYSGSGSSTVYNTAKPAIIVTPIIQNPIAYVHVILSSTNIPAGGAALARLVATYRTGETNVLPLNDLSIIWTSSDTNVLTVGTDGTVNAIGVGSASVTGSAYGFQASASVTVHTPMLTDGFGGTNDFLNHGLLGSGWDGVYLKYGDVPGGSSGADGPGTTLSLNSGINTTNALFLSSIQSDWQGSADDGPFLFKLAPGSINAVSGDFEAAAHVSSEGPMNFEAVGLMARLYNFANGGPGPGSEENHVDYWKVQNGPTSVRRTQNGSNTILVAAGPSPVNSWLLLQRANSTNFYFFEKSASNALWMFVTNTVLATASNNAPMQVGIAQQTLSGATGQAEVDHFMLDAPGILTSLAPPPPASNVLAILNLDFSVTLTYTVGTNSDGTAVGSVVVMRADGPVTAQPYTGMDLAGNPSFGDPNNDLGGGNFVVYRSPPGSLQTGESVTVSNLSPMTAYSVAVYTFAGSGTNRTFNEVGGTPGNPIRPPPLQGIDVGIPSVPLNGIGLIQVYGKYLSRPEVPIVIGPTNPIVTSANTDVAKVLDGIVTGVGLGTTTVSVVYYAPFNFDSLSNSVNVTVRPPTFSDDFGTNHDYLHDGVGGTIFDGIYDPAESYPIPGSSYVPPAGSGTWVADANITSNHTLTITANGDGWEAGMSGGFFAFKYVPGDFQMAVHIQDFTRTNYNQPGLLARAYAATNAVLGEPLGYEVPNFYGTNDTAEYWVSVVRFDEFGIGTYTRLNTDAMAHQNAQPDQGDTNNWLLIVRSSGTNFSFYKKLSLADPWRKLPLSTVYHVSQFAGRPMQAGLVANPWNLASGSPNSVSFDSFMLDLTSSELSVQVGDNGNGSVTVSWPPDPNAVLESSPTLDSPDWQSVDGTRTLGVDGHYFLSVPVGGSARFFRLRN